MKKILLFFATLLFIVSCSKFEEPIIVPLTADDVLAEEAVSEYAVSVDDALATLDIALKSIDGADTRSTDARRVRSVKALKARDVLPATRTEQIPDVEDMFYIVSFDEGEGSAVLGADTRLEGIYAILDETELTPADFVATATRSDAGDGEMRYVATEEELRQFVTSCITSAAYRDLTTPKEDSVVLTQHQDSTLVRVVDLESGEVLYSDPTATRVEILEPIPSYLAREETYIYDAMNQPPLLKTKWDQEASPYNTNCLYNGVRIPAGCVTIAIAQLLYHWSNPITNTIVIGDDSFNCNLLSCYEYDAPLPIYNARTEMARYIYATGTALGINYATGSSGSNIFNAKELLEEMAYTDLGIYTYNISNIDSIGSFYTLRNRIYNDQHPIYVRAQTSNNVSHAWIADGCKYYIKRVYWVYYDSHGFRMYDELKSATTVRLLHFNHGWGGRCDGYYPYNSFDLSNELEDEYIDTSIGDIAFSNPGVLLNTNRLYMMYTPPTHYQIID